MLLAKGDSRPFIAILAKRHRYRSYSEFGPVGIYPSRFSWLIDLTLTAGELLLWAVIRKLWIYSVGISSH